MIAIGGKLLWTSYGSGGLLVGRFRTKSNVLVSSVRVELNGVKAKPSKVETEAEPLSIVVRAESSRYMFDQDSYSR